MKFTIEAKALKTELDYLLKIVENKTRIPILSTILITARDGMITLTGTDLDLYMIVPLKHDATQHFVPGAICVSAKELSKMTAGLTGDLAFDLDKDRLKIVCGKVNIKLSTAPFERFPEIPAIKGDPQIVITGEHLRSMVKDTAFAITKADSRFTLAGFKMIANKDAVKIVTTDGHRLAYTAIKSGFECGGTIDTLIRSKALREAARLSNCTVSITDDGKNHLRFISGGRTLIARKLDGNFPDYELVMPKENDKSVSFDIATFRDAVKRALAVANERSFCVKVTVGKGEIGIESGDSDASRTETIDGSYVGDPLTLAFNGKYLSEYLNSASSTGDGSMSFKDDRNQTEFTIDGYGYDYRYVLMPLHP